MSGRKIRKVVVVGGGPAGASLATYLAREGIQVALFHRSKRPPIIVGESLVPAIVPFLRKLGIEDEVAGYGIFKPGATFVFDTSRNQSFKFNEALGAKVDYSYNVPRDRFDASILEAARGAGVCIIDEAAKLERDGNSDRIKLSSASRERLAEAFEGEPDWIVDAGGRSRVIAGLLGIGATEGPRKDAALHAHLEGVPLLIEGNVHTDRLTRGWCWRIPLPGKVSVGLVVNAEHLAKFGETNEDQYDNVLREEPVLKEWSSGAKRVTPVVRYNNYQLRSVRGVGDGWSMCGDSFGFVDPVFSSGLLIGMDGAEVLARALIDGSEKAMMRYEKHVSDNLTVWQRLVDYYYDGRLFTLFQVGEEVRHQRGWKLLDRHFRRHLPRVFTGEATTSKYSVGLLDFMVKYAITGHDPAELEVR